MDLSIAIPLILIALLSVSEVLALLPGVKSNSIFQLVVNTLRAIKDAITPKPKA
jgi:hypothetical protein